MTDCVYSLIPLVYTGESIDYLPIKWQNDKNIESKYWHCSQLVPGEVFVNCNFGLWGAGLTLTIYNVINYTQQWGNDCVIVSCNRISLMPQLLISGWSKHFPYFVIYSYWPWLEALVLTFLLVWLFFLVEICMNTVTDVDILGLTNIKWPKSQKTVKINFCAGKKLAWCWIVTLKSIITCSRWISCNIEVDNYM